MSGRRDPLAVFWQHQATITPYLGQGVNGELFDTPYVVTGLLAGIVTMPPGGHQESGGGSSILYLPYDTGFVALRSKVTVPELLGGRTVRVVECSVAVLPNPLFPSHVSLVLT